MRRRRIPRETVVPDTASQIREINAANARRDAEEREYQEYARLRQIQLEHDLGFHKSGRPHGDCPQCKAIGGDRG